MAEPVGRAGHRPREHDIRPCEAQDVITTAAVEHRRVGAPAAVHHVAAGVERESVVAVTADRVVDLGAVFDEQVVRHRGAAAERAVVQVDGQVRAVARQVQRVVAAAVEERHDGIGVHREVIHGQQLLRAVQEGVLHVGMVAERLPAGEHARRWNPVQPLRCEQVQPHRRERRVVLGRSSGGELVVGAHRVGGELSGRGNRASLCGVGVGVGGIRLRVMRRIYVGHDGPGAVIVGVALLRAGVNGAVVAARVAKPEQVADLVHQCADAVTDTDCVAADVAEGQLLAAVQGGVVDLDDAGLDEGDPAYAGGRRTFRAELGARSHLLGRLAAERVAVVDEGDVGLVHVRHVGKGHPGQP